MEYDVIVIGGSYAGMAAALQLLRARRSVLVLDSGRPRNRPASSSHGFLGYDGFSPRDITLAARRQLEAYPTLTWQDDRAIAVSGERDRFLVTTTGGHAHQARRILFATGVVDQLPPIAGLSERWGTAVFHCPYCHGYELQQGRIGVIATGPSSTHQAEHLTDWGDVTFLTNDVVELDLDARGRLQARGVVIEDTTIERITGRADVGLSDGRHLPFSGLFLATWCVPSDPLPEQSGCALEETPQGLLVRTDGSKQTSIRGMYAAGDVSRAPHSVSLAVGDGAMAGIQLHRSLIWPDA